MKIKAIGIVLFVFALSVLPLTAFAQDVESSTVEITSGGQAYPSYLVSPASGGPYPAVILIHSFRGLEEGYRTMSDQLAAEGFVVLAVGWQTFEQSPADSVVRTLIEDSIVFLSQRADVDAERIGLTGFCAGGRYTMLLLPQIESLKAGVAWYGFPNNGDPSAADLAADLKAPMLIIHGTDDQASPIAQIYDYASALDAAGASFELKVYADEPHGFMLSGGQLRQDEVAQDAYREMADYFKRKMG